MVGYTFWFIHNENEEDLNVSSYIPTMGESSRAESSSIDHQKLDNIDGLLHDLVNQEPEGDIGFDEEDNPPLNEPSPTCHNSDNSEFDLILKLEN